MNGTTWSVPASTANLGSGFDTLSLALEWRIQVHVEFAANEVSSPREGLAGLATTTARDLLKEFGEADLAGRLVAFTRGDVPIGRGLGSSACAVVGGLLGASELLGSNLSPQELLQRASFVEGHADNAAAALLGGATWTWHEDGKWQARALPVPALTAALFIPDEPLFTREARAVLPQHVPLEDAVSNLSRAGLWPIALFSGDQSLLRAACEDRLHQVARASRLPHLLPALDAAWAHGAMAAFLSGAGSSVLALTTSGKADETALAMVKAAAEVGVNGVARSVGLAREGPASQPEEVRLVPRCAREAKR